MTYKIPRCHLLTDYNRQNDDQALDMTEVIVENPWFSSEISCDTLARLLQLLSITTSWDAEQFGQRTMMYSA